MVIGSFGIITQQDLPQFISTWIIVVLMSACPIVLMIEEGIVTIFI